MPLTFDITPTLTRLIQSPAHTKIITGPRGEGKTTGCYLLWLKLGADACATDPALLPYRVVVIRDTWTHLRDSTIKTLKELAGRGLAVHWGDAEHEALIGGGLVQVLFRGLDTMKDLNLFQGMGAGGLWIEEPAPAAVNDIGSGLPMEVWAVGVTSLRQPGVPHHCLISMNPPEEEHWTLELGRKVAELRRRPEFQDLNLTVEYFRIPKGENPHISNEDRLSWRAALEVAGRGDLVSRLSDGRPGFVVQGEPAASGYSDTRHVAAQSLYPMEQSEIIRLWDYGLTPVCVWAQVSPVGHWHLLDAVIGEGIGLEELIEIHVLPWEQRYLGDRRAWRYRNIGGPEATQPEQTSSKRSALDSMHRLLGAEGGYEAGPIEWAARIGPLQRVLGRMIRGVPLVQVDPDARWIRRTLRGGAYYPKDANGQVVRTVQAMKRVSGLYHNVLDALCHGAAILYPAHPAPPRRPPTKEPRTEHSWMGR